MLESAWHFVGVVALLTTGVAVSTKTTAAGLYANDDGVAIFSGIVGFLSWGVWTYGTLNVEVITNTGTVVQQSYPALTYLGLALALIPAFIALTGPADIIRRARDPKTEEL